MIIIYIFFTSLLAAEPLTSNETITVEAHKAFEVYVAPTKVINKTSYIEAVIPEDIIFSLTSIYSKAFDTPKFMVYNQATIEYTWDNCNYDIDYKKCAYKNDHYTLETKITIDRQQMVVAMYLYDPNLQVISIGIITDESTVSWIRQQKTIMENKQTVSPLGTVLNTQTVTQEPEKLPLRWEISPSLLIKHLRQASIHVWTGAKINE